MIIYIALLIIFIAIPLLGFRSYYLKSKTKERLNFGIEKITDTPDVDLAAGDYGLTGYDRFIYYLSQFLSTQLGSLFIFGLGATVGAILSFGPKKGVLSDVGMAALLTGFVVYIIAKLLLRGSAQNRVLSIKEELPNALQMTAAIMESGLGFESAIRFVIKESNIKHPLYFDLAVMAEAMQSGRRRHEALKLWSERTQEQSVSDVAAAMVQADETGSSLGAVLKHHADSLMRENEAAMLRRAERLPIKMLFPMVVFILLPVLVIAAGPSVLKIFHVFEEIMSRA